MRALLAVSTLAILLAGCPDPAGSCAEGSFSCGDPAGGPACCPVGDSCCFGYDLCCKETYPHLGQRHSDGAKMCYQSLTGEGDTWTLLTVCGKPASY
ncbi:MAG TPA: hypothetical protein VLT47_01880 [Anaeromyxobacteraceae bacterium]|nr:hypothetical protein [Anaeromyxobacteraceae bacterium]